MKLSEQETHKRGLKNLEKMFELRRKAHPNFDFNAPIAKVMKCVDMNTGKVLWEWNGEKK